MHYFIRTLYIAILVLFASFSLAIDGNGNITSQGIQRDFIYHAPGATVAEDLPVVLVFHGTGGSAQNIQSYSGFDAVADANGFLVVYPNSTNIGGIPQWNVYADDVAGHGGIGEPTATDDVIFIDDLLEHLCSTFNIDPSRVYATGHSNGGFMAYLLAVQRPGKIAAIAPVAANLWGDDVYLTNYYTNDYTPIAVMHLHGDADNVVDYPDPNNDPTEYIWPLSAFAYGNCANTGYQSSNITAVVQRLVFCDGTGSNPQPVELIRFIGLGHTWPNVSGYDTASEIWDFFNDHSVIPIYTCDMNSVGDLDPIGTFNVHPNPSNGTIWIEGPVQIGSNLQLIDLTGRIISTQQLTTAHIDLAGRSPGTYMLKIIDRNGSFRSAQIVLQ